MNTVKLYRLQAQLYGLRPVRQCIFTTLGEARSVFELLQPRPEVLRRPEVLHVQLHELELDTALTPQDWADLVQTGPGMRTDAILRDRLTVGPLLAEWRAPESDEHVATV